MTLDFPGSISSGAASCCLCSLVTGVGSLAWALAALEELFGSVQRAIFGNLLLGAAPPGESVQVLQLAKAFCHALGCKTSFWVMVPALSQCLTHHLDALQWKRSPNELSFIISQSPYIRLVHTSSFMLCVLWVSANT